MSGTPKVMVLRTAGTNCDKETVQAFELAGAAVRRVHVNRLFDGSDSLDAYGILAIPAGFTYGDDIAAGGILANELRHRLRDALLDFVASGKLVIGICNGFQVLVKTGLLPGRGDSLETGDATLTLNDSGKFEDRWVCLHAGSQQSPFLQGIESLYLPVAHAEGKFVTRSPDVLDALDKQGQIALRYTGPGGASPEYPWNPNGSQDDIAGITDPTGRVFGLMPHPERHILPTQHPRWTREGLSEKPDGLAIFQNAVRFAAGS